mgnify:CR=1 FL=1
MWYRSPKMPEAYARVQWCRQVFGNSFGESRPKKGWKWNDMRWYRNGGYIFFKQQEDLVLYLLRWS